MKTQYFFEINGKISSCFSCPFHFSDGDIHCVLKKSIICLTYEKPSKCPLVVLPPHGDIGDISDLYANLMADIQTNKIVNLQDVIRIINEKFENAPVVLKANYKED